MADPNEHTLPQHRKPRILVVRIDRIGDVVLSTPLIRALRQTYPNAYIAVMVQPYAVPVLEGNPSLDEIIIDDPERKHAGRAGFWNRVRAVRARRFDTALLLLPSERAAWMLLLAGIRTRIGVGHKLYEMLTFMRTVSRRRYIPLRHEADYCLDLGRAIGVQSDDLTTEIALAPSEHEEARRILEGLGVDFSRMRIGMTPGSGHSSPNWEVRRYVDMALELVARYHATIIVSGSPSEGHLVAEFRQTGSPDIIVLPQLPLRNFIGVMSHYNYFFSASTGPMHIAAALKVPTLSLFCPLPACSPQLWGPKGNASGIVLAPDTVCQKTCERDPHLCTMHDITVQHAIDEFERLHKKIDNK